MDSVRHSASGILLNLAKLGSSLKQDGLWAQFIIAPVCYIPHAAERPVTLYARHTLDKHKLFCCYHKLAKISP
jgi:hypothetical protein